MEPNNRQAWMTQVLGWGETDRPFWGARPGISLWRLIPASWARG